MQVNYNLGAAQFESISETHQRISQSNPQQTMTDYTAAAQSPTPPVKVYPVDDPPRSKSPIEVIEAESSRVENRKQIRNAMNRSVDNAAGHVRQYYEAMDERGQRGQKLLARA